jgi:hypothetical protein
MSRYAAFQFLEDYGPHDSSQILRTEYIKGTPITRRRLMYRQLVYHNQWQQRDVDTHGFRTSLPRKLRRFSPAASKAQMLIQVARLKANLKLAGAIPRLGQWNTWFCFITNALPTDKSIAAAGILPPNRNPDRPQACFMCKNGKDDLRHVFGDCPAV